MWFINGCSTGFGRELSTQALARGFRTVVTARKPEAGEALGIRVMVVEPSGLWRPLPAGRIFRKIFPCEQLMIMKTPAGSCKLHHES